MRSTVFGFWDSREVLGFFDFGVVGVGRAFILELGG